MSRSGKRVRVVGTVGALGTAVLLCGPGVGAETQQGQPRPRPVLNFVGVTAHAWGMWVEPGVDVEDWVEEARGYCAPEQFCEVNVFEGAELATHESPVPEANRAALKWVFTYRHDETPRIMVEEAHTAPGQETRRWTFEE
jgi:hypothetical protein